MILSDDTNGAGGANLTSLICLLLHHHQLTSLILLHQHQLTSTRVCPIWPISLACGSGPFLWSKHKTKIAQMELNFVESNYFCFVIWRGRPGVSKRSVCCESRRFARYLECMSLYIFYLPLYVSWMGGCPQLSPRLIPLPTAPYAQYIPSHPIPSHPVRFALLFSPTCSSSPKRKIILQVKMPSVFDRHEKEYSTVSKWWWWWIIAIDLQNKKKQILNYLRAQSPPHQYLNQHVITIKDINWPCSNGTL